MGVSGSGKSRIGAELAASLGWEFHDADELHPESNKDKMRRGVALSDEDRRPWLAHVRALIDECRGRGVDAVVACSALKQAYRDLLLGPGVKLVYLRGSRELIAARLAKRRGHFMPPALLDSQFATLEEPADAVVVDISSTPSEIVAVIRAQLML